MGKVNLLPQDIVSKIAAGEVIERPASCLKELIENALDAETSRIEIHTEQSGKKLISVTDSGSGILPDDMEKIFIRHSTSKIKNLDDLDHIDSLGFRGEALYSIAAISDVILRSKVRGQDTGWEMHVHGGKNMGIKPVNMREGTEIDVRELFFNTPARRKFMKSDHAELNQIINTFIPYTLIYPSYEFSLHNYKKPLFDLPPENNRISRVSNVLHLRKENIIEAYKSDADGDLSVRLFLGDINIQRVKRDMQFIFVNDRPVNDKNISFHLNQVYRLIMPQGTYPFFAAFINLPHDQVDVNMHPTKREIRIKDDRRLVHLMRPLAEHTLMAHGKPKKIMGAFASPDESAASAAEKKHDKISQFDILESFDPGIKSSTPLDTAHVIKHDDIIEHQKNLFDDAPSTLKNDDPENLKSKLYFGSFLSTFLNKYILYSSGTSIIIMDQHAAQERIVFEDLVRQVQENKVEVQHLISPIVARLTTQEMLAWESLHEKLDELGISTTQWDKESIAIHSHPQLIHKPHIALRNILAGKDTSSVDIETLARWACRKSCMAGDTVKKEFAEFLRERLLECSDPFTCPHGRPTVIEIDEKFLNKQFLR